MEMAYIFLVSILGFDDEIQEVLKDAPGVREIFMVQGIYDMILKVETDTMGELKELIKKINNEEKVHSALSMIVI